MSNDQNPGTTWHALGRGAKQMGSPKTNTVVHVALSSLTKDVEDRLLQLIVACDFNVERIAPQLVDIGPGVGGLASGWRVTAEQSCRDVLIAVELTQPSHVHVFLDTDRITMGVDPVVESGTGLEDPAERSMVGLAFRDRLVDTLALIFDCVALGREHANSVASQHFLLSQRVHA